MQYLQARIANESIVIAEHTRVIEQVASMLALGGEADEDKLLFSDLALADALFDGAHGHIKLDPISESGSG